jgi:hypothetical protein
MELFANGGRLVRGGEGARKIMAAAWSSPVYGLPLHHFERLGDDTVLGVGSVRYEGDTGFSQRTAAWLWHMEDGMIRRAQTSTTNTLRAPAVRGVRWFAMSNYALSAIFRRPVPGQRTSNLSLHPRAPRPRQRLTWADRPVE